MTQLERYRDNAMSEKDFMQRVIDQARLLGWMVFHTHDARRSEPGFPDLVMIRGHEMIVAELKVGKNRTTPAQEKWLHAFAEVGHPHHAIRAFVWRPSDQAEIDQALGSRGRGMHVETVTFCSGCGHSPHEERCTSNVHGEECGCERRSA